MVISVHIPKCAGTSFRSVLEKRYGAELWSNYGEIFTSAEAQSEKVPRGTRCIHGHFFADAFDALYPRRRLITWLRHPVERVVSNYFHCLRGPDMRDDCCRKLHEEKLTLRQFAELDWMRNNAARYLAGKKLSEFSFVGIAERFAESLTIFTRTFGYQEGWSIPFENSNLLRPGDYYSLSAEDFAYLQQLNAIDLAMYEEAVALLDYSLRDSRHRAAA